MSGNASQRIVRLELLLSCVAVVNGGMLAFSTELQSGDLVVGAVVALLTAALCAGADRSRLWIWVLGAAGVLATGALVAVETEPWLVGVLPAAMVGLGVGWLLNRLLFGVVGSVPETRVERGFGRLG